jgi:threonine synthase
MKSNSKKGQARKVANESMSALSHLECARCQKRHDATRLHQRCECGGTLLARYDLGSLGRDVLARMRERPGGTWRYRELLPVKGEAVSLGEVETPLLFCPRLSEEWGVEIWLKDDGLLPGGTFKARSASVALSRALELGAKRFVMPSAGNAGGAWSLYAARAGVELTVTMAETAPRTNQAEVRAAGAELVLVAGTIADAGRRAQQIAEETGAFLAATFFEPYRLEGKKACWLEVFDGLASDEGLFGLPKTIVMPVGGGVAAISAAKAFEEVAALGWATGGRPRIVGVQAEDCPPIARAFERGDAEVEPWPKIPTTIASGLRVPAPVEGTLVLECVRASSGRVLAVGEADIVSSVARLTAAEGIFACPEGATTVAAAQRLHDEGDLEGPVVLYNTGSGPKYADALAGAGLGA